MVVVVVALVTSTGTVTDTDDVIVDPVFVGRLSVKEMVNGVSVILLK